MMISRDLQLFGIGLFQVIKKQLKISQVGQMIRQHWKLNSQNYSKHSSNLTNNYLYLKNSICCQFHYLKLAPHQLNAPLLDSSDRSRNAPVQLEVGVWGDAHHAAGRTLSAVTHAGVPEADGFLYHSRFTGHACVAVFSRALTKLEALDVRPLERSSDFLDALDDYEITLTTPR